MYYLLLERKERRPSSADVVPKAIRKEHAHILGKLHQFFKLSSISCYQSLHDYMERLKLQPSLMLKSS
jgi:hypothetical protein